MISNNNKLKVVLSGVNINEAGQLKVFKEMIEAFLKKDVNLTCLVHNKILFKSFANTDINFIQFPHVKKSWFSRINFEYFKIKKISKDLNADIWINMQDTSANTKCKNSFVYCHNPSPFAEKSFHYLFFDWKFFLWTFLYKYLYAINISSNKAVIVQQEWIASKFKEKFNVKSLIVARPKRSSIDYQANNRKIEEITFIYPSISRVFKNFELILKAIDYFNNTYPHLKEKISCKLTFDESSNSFGKYIVKKFEHLPNVQFIGYTDFEVVQKLLKKSTIGIFPSKLETWGLPINEYQENSLPIIVANLPYAYETVGNYNKVHFIDPDNYKYLASLFKKILDGDEVFYESNYQNVNQIVSSYDKLADRIIELSN